MKFELHKKNQRILTSILFVLPFLLYWNAINNEYAIDDNLVVDGVAKIEDGFAAIPTLFTSFYSEGKKQSYGYRPIVSTSFAIEKQFFSGLPAKQTPQEKLITDRLTQANISHFVNILLYALTGLLLLYVLKQIFPDERQKFLPYLIVFVFLILPIHTENVNNLKNRDSLLMVLGMLGAVSGFVSYAKEKKSFWPFLLAVGCFIVALFSKKSAVALVGIIPVILYYVKAPTKKIIGATVGVLVSFLIAVLLKRMMLPQPGVRDIKYFENPLLFDGTIVNRIATGFYSLFFYLKMMIWPGKFSFYYGFSKIPLIDFSYIQVWLGILIFVPLAIFGIIKWWKRDELGLGIVLWLGVSLGLINWIFPIVGVVADRFAYLPSIGFSMVVGVLLFRLFKLTSSSKEPLKIPELFIGILVLVLFAYTTKIMNRNTEWENYLTLFKADIGHLEKSAKANVLLATRIFGTLGDQKTDQQKKQVITQTTHYYRQALDVYPKYGAAINNLAVMDINYLGKYDEAIELLHRVEDSGRDNVIFNLAYAYYKDKQYDKAIDYLVKSIKRNPERANFYDVLAVIGEKPGYQKKMMEGLESIAPSLEDFSSYFDVKLASLYYQQSNSEQALYYYKKAAKLDPDNRRLETLIENMENLD